MSTTSSPRRPSRATTTSRAPASGSRTSAGRAAGAPSASPASIPGRTTRPTGWPHCSTHPAVRGLLLHPWEETFPANSDRRGGARRRRRGARAIRCSSRPGTRSWPRRSRCPTSRARVDGTVVMTRGGQVNMAGLAQQSADLALAAAPNLCALSAGMYRQDWLESCVRQFGAARLLYGSCAPVFDLGYEVQRVRRAEMDDDARAAVLGGNAAAAVRNGDGGLMRRVLITGGASGIGAACVRRFQGDGCSVAVLDRDQARAGGEPRGVRHDLRRRRRRLARRRGRRGRSRARRARRRGRSGRHRGAWHRRRHGPGRLGSRARREPAGRLPDGARDDPASARRRRRRDRQHRLAARSGRRRPRRRLLRLEGRRDLAHACDGDRPRARGDPGQLRLPGADRHAAAGPVLRRRGGSGGRARAYEAMQLHARLVTADEIAGAVAYLAAPGASSTMGAALVVDGGYIVR